MVTPLKPVELMLGKTIPFALISFFDMALVTTIGVFWFDVPIKGSIPLLVLSTAIYLLSVVGWALHFHHLQDPAAGADGHLPLLHTRGPPLRVRVSY